MPVVGSEVVGLDAVALVFASWIAVGLVVVSYEVVDLAALMIASVGNGVGIDAIFGWRVHQ